MIKLGKDPKVFVLMVFKVAPLSNLKVHVDAGLIGWDAGFDPIVTELARVDTVVPLRKSIVKFDMLLLVDVPLIEEVTLPLNVTVEAWNLHITLFPL